MSGIDRQNIEIKVRLSEAGHRRIEQNMNRLVTGAGNLSTDVDTYFHVPRGRLKLRVSNNDPAGTLVFYERPNEATSRLSHYRLVPTPDALALREALAHALGVLVTVSKRRTVFIHGQTRIHFDVVDGLGRFVELETVIGSQGYDAALAEHRSVIDTLGLESAEVVPESYSDLLLDSIR
jgi:adenylate cyclase class IV